MDRNDVGLTKFVASTTLDPELLARAVRDLSDGELSRLSPRTYLPTWYVAAAQKDRLPRALFAIMYCNDHEYLTSLAATKIRATISSALLTNPYFTDPLRDKSIPAPYQIPAAIISNPRTPVASSSAISLIAAHLEDLPALADALLNAFAVQSARYTLEISKFLGFAYGLYPPRPGPVEEFRRAVTISPVELISRCSDPAPALGLFIEDVLDHRPQIPLDLDIISLVTSRVPKLSRLPVRCLPDERRFTDAALDHILQDPALDRLLASTQISDTHFDAILARTPKQNYHKLVSLLHARPYRLARLANLIPNPSPHYFSDHVDTLIECLDGPDDPLFDWVLRAAGPKQLRTFILGSREDTNANQLFITPDLLIAALKRLECSTKPDEYRQFSRTLSATISYVATMPKDVLRVLCDLLPGYAYNVKQLYPVSSYIYDTLAATGADMDLALDQFEIHGPDVSLDTITSVLSRLAHMNEDSE